MCYNTDKPQKKYGKWEKPATKDYVLYDAVYRIGNVKNK